MTAYRAAWSAYLFANERTTREALESTMDSLQPLIAERANTPEWESFAKSLPGFLEHWSNQLLKSLATAEEHR